MVATCWEMASFDDTFLQLSLEFVVARERNTKATKKRRCELAFALWKPTRYYQKVHTDVVSCFGIFRRR
jgi:hypothetical protein